MTGVAFVSLGGYCRRATSKEPGNMVLARHFAAGQKEEIDVNAAPDRNRSDTRRIRRRGGTGFLLSALAAGVWLALVSFAWQEGQRFFGPGLALPLVPALVFLTETITGRRFPELARAWDELAGWQRALLGVVIVAVAGAVIVGGVGLALSIILSP